MNFLHTILNSLNSFGRTGVVIRFGTQGLGRYEKQYMCPSCPCHLRYIDCILKGKKKTSVLMVGVSSY